MTTSIPYTATPHSLTMMINGKTYVLTADSHQHYATIREALKTKDFETVLKLIDLARAIEKFGAGQITVVDGEIMYNGEVMHNAVTTRLLEQMKEGFDVNPLIKFLENLLQNPSKRALDELYGFLEVCALPITEDGHFLAYKKVDFDYSSFHRDTKGNKVWNRIGDVLEMPRNTVDDNKDRTCSHGLHFCSLSYLPCYFGGRGRIMIVKINPRDVVSIPSDYNNAKGRACKYEIIGEYEGSENEEYFKSSIYDSSTCEPYTGYASNEAADTEDWSEDGFDAQNQYHVLVYTTMHEFEDERLSQWVHDTRETVERAVQELVSTVDDVYSDVKFGVVVDTNSNVLHVYPESFRDAVMDELSADQDDLSKQTANQFLPENWPFPRHGHPVEQINVAVDLEDKAPTPRPTPEELLAHIRAVAATPVVPATQVTAPQTLYTREEAAKKLGITQDALRKRLDRGVTVQRDFSTGKEMVRLV